MFQSLPRKDLQQSSSSSLPQIDEDKTNNTSTPTSSTKAVRGGRLGWKKIVDAFNMSDSSLDHSDAASGDDSRENSVSSSMSALTNIIMPSTPTTSLAAKKKKNNVERWSQNQAMNLQPGSSTRWSDNDVKSRPRDYWN